MQKNCITNVINKPTSSIRGLKALHEKDYHELGHIYTELPKGLYITYTTTTIMICNKCKYEWITKSKLAYVSCPSCLNKVRKEVTKNDDKQL